MRVSGGVMAGQILHKDAPAPVDPAIIYGQNNSGAVVLAVTIDPWGKVSAVRVISGPQVLHEAFLASVRTWTYKPYLLNGQPVYVQTTVVINH